jgi:hypothetical protein
LRQQVAVAGRPLDGGHGLSEPLGRQIARNSFERVGRRRQSRAIV